MNDTITTTGIVGTTPRTATTSEGVTITSSRLAAQQRRFDASKDGKEETNWYTVTAFRLLAENTFTSLQKDDHILVTGRLRVREWENGDRTGTSVEIDAKAIAHDLNWGTTTFTRATHKSDSSPDSSGQTVVEEWAEF